ncbi:Carboxypeptidase Taq (M32) metallopeptidase [Gracilaria domingensis]|nr:Carboxypeptidase Taq (M32) metallopeptidase [Gracilaria domingensis]
MSPARPPPLGALCALWRDLSDLGAVSSLLGWDEQVMMPPGAAVARARQKAAMAAVIHDKATSDQLRAAIAAAQRVRPQLDAFEAALVRDADREFRRAVAVPRELEKKIAANEVQSVRAWVAARADGDFGAFEPRLRVTLQLAREKAVAINPEGKPYDTMIDVFERGMSSDRLAEIFAAVADPLKAMLEDVLEMKSKCERKVHPALLGGELWDVQQQAQLSRDISTMLGFDLERGRIDVSVHPFTGGAGQHDVRITTRYSTQQPFEGVMATIHETGHAMYEQGRSTKHAGLPVSEPLSMGVHESQSLFWERMVGQNVNFWRAMLPKIHERLPHTKEVSADDLFFAVNQVNRGFIRVDADELTYPFHVMLRFELERKLLDGSLDVKDLPQAWNEGMKKHLGVEVQDDKQGCLQDIHWPSGAFGYFPSYTLGAIMAAQLFRYLKKNVMPDVEDRIASGEFGGIREWLRAEIHEVGSLYESLDELLQNVTGETLNPQHFVDHLRDKYATLYS